MNSGPILASPPPPGLKLSQLHAIGARRSAEFLELRGLMLNPSISLLQWYAREARDLPWRRTRDPYKIWLSEVILQQTRVDQGLGYYLRFVERFPTVEDLAAADTDTLMKYWEGLGYYSRARNLHHTAKIIVNDHAGVFPGDFRDLLKLKGIGPYTIGRPPPDRSGKVSFKSLYRPLAGKADLNRNRGQLKRVLRHAGTHRATSIASSRQIPLWR